MNTFKLLAMGSPISIRKYISNDSIIPPLASISLIIIVPIYLLILLYYFCFGYKYTYMGKLLSLIFIISIALESVISLHSLTAQINKKNAFKDDRKSFIQSFMYYFHTKFNNTDEKDALRYYHIL
jgi:hypothetical protein